MPLMGSDGSLDWSRDTTLGSKPLAGSRNQARFDLGADKNLSCRLIRSWGWQIKGRARVQMTLRIL